MFFKALLKIPPKSIEAPVYKKWVKWASNLKIQPASLPANKKVATKKWKNMGEGGYKARMAFSVEH